MQVGCNIGQRWFGAQAIQHAWHPLVEQCGIGGGQAELILGAADAVFNAQLLDRLKPGGNAGHARNALLQALDNLARAGIALVVGLEVNQQTAGVEGDIAAIDADKRRKPFDFRVLQNQLGEDLLLLAHRLEGNILRRFSDSLNNATVLNREKALGYREVEASGKRHCAQHDRHSGARVLQHFIQTAPVAFDQVAHKVAFIMAGRVFEHARAHHGGEGERDQQ